MLIGVFAKSEEQTVVFVLIPMFVLSGLGGAWMPPRVHGAAFQSIGHVSPGGLGHGWFKNITARGRIQFSVAAGGRAGWVYASLFILAAWRFQRVSE